MLNVACLFDMGIVKKEELNNENYTDLKSREYGIAYCNRSGWKSVREFCPSIRFTNEYKACLLGTENYWIPKAVGCSLISNKCNNS